MIRAPVLHYVRFARHFLWVSVLVGTHACVTTTIGGFNVEPSGGESLENYIQQVVAYFDADDMPNARRLLNSAPEIDSRNSEACNILLPIPKRQGDLEFMMDNFQRAVRLGRDNSRARQAFRQFLTTSEFFSLTHTPRALLGAISIESGFNTQKLVDDFPRILTTPYQSSPAYAELKRKMNGVS